MFPASIRKTFNRNNQRIYYTRSLWQGNKVNLPNKRDMSLIAGYQIIGVREKEKKKRKRSEKTLGKKKKQNESSSTISSRVFVVD